MLVFQEHHLAQVIDEPDTHVGIFFREEYNRYIILRRVRHYAYQGLVLLFPDDQDITVLDLTILTDHFDAVVDDLFGYSRNIINE